ncbi:hypothetical protein Clacol_010583 [Clathrus columnatus]|uniref:Uncharacterized protein n=1 Tax=Clathrus columnatus TaxID=1419009 RepID=A0AAV5AR88_9AGAM|nr:hypothetical protein Clacol_010583 [Clathrus columnatus]
MIHAPIETTSNVMKPNVLHPIQRNSSLKDIPVRQQHSRSLKKPRCLKLSRLQKSTHIKSLCFKRTLPGKSGHLAYGPFSKFDPSLDKSHPLASLTPQQLLRSVPHYRCSLFTLNCYPFAVLKKFENLDYILQFKQKQSSNELHKLISSVDHEIRLPLPSHTFPNDIRREKETLPMPLMVVLPKHVHKSGFIRSQIKQRLKEALKLVIIRGAVQTESSNDNAGLDFPENPLSDRQLLLKNWVYTFRPTAEMYLASWVTLLNEIRRAMVMVKQVATTKKDQDVSGSFNHRKISNKSKHSGADDAMIFGLGTRPLRRAFSRSAAHKAAPTVELKAKKIVPIGMRFKMIAAVPNLPSKILTTCIAKLKALAYPT